MFALSFRALQFIVYQYPISSLANSLYILSGVTWISLNEVYGCESGCTDEKHERYSFELMPLNNTRAQVILNHYPNAVASN